MPDLLEPARDANRISPYDELRAQVEKIIAAGITPDSHLDTHKHTHLLFPVLVAVARLSEEFRDSLGAPAVRFPSERRQANTVGQACISESLQVLRNRFHSQVGEARVPDHRLLCGLPVDRIPARSKNSSAYSKSLPEG